MRLLFVSNLFPNRIDPIRGRYNFNQVNALRALGCEIDVIAPVPRFPLLRSPWMKDAHRLPFRETVGEFDVYHPRALYLPRSTGAINGVLYEWSTRGTIERHCETHGPAALWASFAFPDGVAVGAIAARRRLPFVVSLLGSDINLNLHDGGRLGAMTRSLGRAALVLAKSRALKDIVVSLGIPAGRVMLDYNGVDQEIFHPRDRDASCARCGVDTRVARILFVGNFVDVKDIPTLVRAFAVLAHESDLPRGLELVLVGDGPLKPEIRRLATTHRIEDRIVMPGERSHAEVAEWMGASDVLCLPSRNEGVPNVVLEALASGLPVVASRVGGTPEVHRGDVVGALFEQGNIAALVAALRRTITRTWDRSAVSASVNEFTWAANAGRVKHALTEVLAARQSRPVT